MLALLLALLLPGVAARPARATSDECIVPQVENSEATYCYYSCYTQTDSSSQHCRDKSGLSYDIPNGSPVPTSWPTHDMNTQNMFLGVNGVKLHFTLPQLYDLKGVHYWNFNEQRLPHGSGPNAGCCVVNIAVSTDSIDGTYTHVGSFTFKRAPGSATYTGDSLKFDFPVLAKFVEFSMDSSWGDRGSGLSELRFIGAKSSVVLGVQPPAPKVGTFLAIAPNPVRSSTQILYSLSRDSDTSLDVLDVTGRAVAHLAQGHQAAGVHTVSWDTRDSNGAEPPAGMYFARLTTGSVSVTKRLALVR
jgi:hypothetical protein